MIGIYMIKNKVNNKCYIGQSINIINRWYGHKNSLRHNTHGNKHLQNAWNKYGEDNFEFIVLEECKEDELNDKEIYWISKLGGNESPDLYNYRAGGDSGGALSDETKKKISLSLLNTPPWNKGLTKDDPRVAKYCMKKGEFHHTESTKKKISNTIRKLYEDGVYNNVDYSKRPKMSKEQYNKIHDKCRGQKRTLEQCKNISEGKLLANAKKRELGLPTRIKKNPTPMKISICEVCGKEFTQRQCRYKKTCSNECRYKLSSIKQLKNNKEDINNE